MGRGSTRLSTSLGDLGYFIAKRPYLVLAVSLVITLALCSGLVTRLESETAIDKLW